MSVRDSAITILTNWKAPDPTQEALRHAVLAFTLARTDACLRECVPGHLTASTLVLDHRRSQVLLTLHPRLGRWVQLGGHCDDTDLDIVAAARREAIEESGISGLHISAKLIAIHVHPVTCSLGVPTRHLDLQFAAWAPPDAQITRSEESLDLQWWPIDALPADTDHALAQLVTLARRATASLRAIPTLGLDIAGEADPTVREIYPWPYPGAAEQLTTRTDVGPVANDCVPEQRPRSDACTQTDDRPLNHRAGLHPDTVEDHRAVQSDAGANFRAPPHNGATH